MCVWAATAAAAPATLRLVDGSPSLGSQVTVATPGGGTFTADPARFVVVITPAGGVPTERTAWCVDGRTPISTGIDYDVDLQTPAEDPALAGAAYLEAGWLMARSEALLAAAADPDLEAGAIQVAIWQLTGQAADITAVTGDPALDDRVAELRALARGTTLTTSLSLAGPAGTLPAGAAATFVVTGTPGAEVDLAVSGGSGSLSATRVALDAAGRATVQLAGAGAGVTTVTATAAGGVLTKAARIPGAASPQEVAFVLPSALAATATASFAAPAGPAAAAAGAATAQRRPRTRLRLTKSAPARVVAGGDLVYTLRVENVGAVRARGVVLRDPLSERAFLPGLPARSLLVGGAVVWRLGDIAPGGAVTVRLRVRPIPAGPVRLGNVATVRAANAPSVRSGAVTRVIPVRAAPARVVPAVTG